MLPLAALPLGAAAARHAQGAALARTIAGLSADGGVSERALGLLSHPSLATPSLHPRQLLASGTLRRGVYPARANRRQSGEKFKLWWRLGLWVSHLCAGEKGTGGGFVPSGRGMADEGAVTVCVRVRPLIAR